MDASDFVGTVEIGKRTRDPQDAVIAAGGKLHGIGGIPQQRQARSVGPCNLFEYRALRLRIGAHAGQTQRGIALGLDIARAGDARGEFRGCLPTAAAK